MDDILITGPTDAAHLANQEEVLQRLKRYGIRAKQSKCEFIKSEVVYLGHKVDAQGLHTTKKKVEAVLSAPQPNNVTKIGLLHYYNKFLPNLLSLLILLNQLLRNNSKWKWTQECSEALIAAKRLIASAPVLAYYNPELPLKMAGDASAYGLGAILSLVFQMGSDLWHLPHERYHLQKEIIHKSRKRFSLIFGINKFHQYLYGRHFTLVTDHKPLTTLISLSRGVPPLVTGHLQRRAWLLSAYSYNI